MRADFSVGRKPIFGLSFSPYYAQSLHLNWQEVYLSAIKDLGVDHLRLAAYWDKIEVTPGQYYFDDLDWQMNIARENKVKVILSVGRKLPRWPECFDPSWLRFQDDKQQRAAVLNIVKKVVERYKDYDNLIVWQVENEPLVGWFGVCPKPDQDLLQQEVELVKSLDDTRPIMITDSGELSTWWKASQQGDILGTTMYRVISNPIFGFWSWPLPPSYYYYKAELIKKIHGLDKVIVSELQAEPWSVGALTDMPLAIAYRSMSIEQFHDNIYFARRAGFEEIYLWGVEWWYWMKETKGVADFWTLADGLWTADDVL